MAADLVAALDQVAAALRDMAVVIGRYRLQLIEQGMDRDDALELCLALQRRILFGDLEEAGGFQ